jgi:hypothetical protein
MSKPKHFSWFKFDWNAWRHDPQLRRCSKETRGFWVDVISVMEEQDTYFIEGTPEELCRDIVCSEGEFDRSIAELERTKAASIQKGQGFVKIISRRILKARNLTEYNKLKKQEERDRKAVNVMSSDSSKNRVLEKKEKKEEEELRELTEPAREAASSPSDIRKAHPAIVAIQDLTQRYPPKEIWDEIIDQLGTDIDHARLRKCFVTWIGRSYNKQNFDWAFDWYVNNRIPTKGQQNGNGTHSKPSSEREKSAQRTVNSLEFIDKLEREGHAERSGQALPGSSSEDGPEVDQPRQLTGTH